MFCSNRVTKSLNKSLVAGLFAILFAGLVATLAIVMSWSSPASAQVAPVNSQDPVAVTPTTTLSTTTIPQVGNTTNTTVVAPNGPTGPTSQGGTTGSATLNLNLPGALNKPSESIVIILLVTVLSVAPALLMMTTSFTRIIIVLTLTRNALGVSTVPPNQVLVGLALFLSLFVMSPTLSAMNKDGLQPYLNGKMNQTQAFNAGVIPLKQFMLKNTRVEELSLFEHADGNKKPATAESVNLTALIPAFILSEMKTAFIIGFVIFIPFLVIDIIVSSSLMSMGMMMLPPQMISLPFKLLLFVLVDGWGLVIKSLLSSFQ